MSWAEVHAHGQQVMTENVTQIIVTHLADIGSLAAKTCDSTNRVGSRTATHLHGCAQCFVQMQRSISVDQRHRPFHQRLLMNEIVIGMSDHVD